MTGGISAHSCFIWTVDSTTAKIWNTACPIEPGFHKFGVTCSPLPAQFSVCVVEGELRPGHQYSISVDFSVMTVHKTGATFTLTDDTTGTIVCQKVGLKSPMRSRYPGNGKPIDVQDLESVVGRPIDTTAVPFWKLNH